MNNDLLKRIDALLALRVENSATSTINNDCPLDPAVEKALRDCRAEIERKATYVPMTGDEISQMMQDWYNDTSDETSLPRFIEAAVIKRLGLEIKHG